MPDYPDLSNSVGSVNSVSPNSPTVPVSPNPDGPASLTAGLQGPQGIVLPGSSMTDVARPQAPPAPQDAAHNLMGRTVGKVLSGLSGGHDEYSIDPQTGQTVSTRVKESPGQTFRSILALGLMGGQGIGPAHGQFNFAQGLMAGLGGGVRESQERKDMLDKQRRDQAQQQYANQLRAAQEDRENKKLTMDQELNRVNIADHNQGMAYREQMMHQQATLFDQQQGSLSAAPYIKVSEMQTAADKPYVDGYKALGVEPIKVGIGEAEEQAYINSPAVQKYLHDNPGASVNQIALHTDTKQTWDPATKTMKVEPLYSIYPPMTKVPKTILEAMESAGATAKDNKFHNMYSDLKGAGDGEVSTGKIFNAYKQMHDWEPIHHQALEDDKLKSEIARNYMEKSDASLSLQLKRMALNDKQDMDTAKLLASSLFNSATGTLVPDWQQKITIDPHTGKEIKDPNILRKNLQLFNAGISGFYDTVEKDFYDRYPKNADGFYNPEDKQGRFKMQLLEGIRNAQYAINGGKMEDLPPSSPNFTDNGVPFAIPASKIEAFLKDHPNAVKFSGGAQPQGAIPNTATSNPVGALTDWAKQNEKKNPGVYVPSF